MFSHHNVSDLSSSNQTSVQNQIIGNSSVQIQRNVISYANATQKDQFPTKEQAIILDSIDGIPLKDYTHALGKLVNPTNIRFVSRISKNRVCMYLANKEIADKLTVNKTTIQVGNQELEIRPLLTKFKRIIISNVCPVIPHSVLINELNNLNIRLGSTITFLRAGLSDPGYSHILSFRRQVYIHPDDVSKLPESLKITHDDTSYWVYLSADAISCFICKQVGHIAKNCKENSDIDLSSSKSVLPLGNTPTTNDADMHLNSEDNFPPLNSLPAPVSVQTISVPTKRPLSVSSSESEPQSSLELSLSSQSDASQNKLEVRSEKKKSKVDPLLLNDSTRLDNQLEPVKLLLSSPNNNYPLNFLQLKSLIENSKTIQTVTDLSSNYTSDIPSLIKQIDDSYKFLNDKGIKRRFTSLKKKLLFFVNENDLSGSVFSDGSVDDSLPSN